MFRPGVKLILRFMTSHQITYYREEEGDPGPTKRHEDWELIFVRLRVISWIILFLFLNL